MFYVMNKNFLMLAIFPVALLFHINLCAQDIKVKTKMYDNHISFVAKDRLTYRYSPSQSVIEGVLRYGKSTSGNTTDYYFYIETSPINVVSKSGGVEESVYGISKIQFVQYRDSFKKYLGKQVKITGKLLYNDSNGHVHTDVYLDVSRIEVFNNSMLFNYPSYSAKQCPSGELAQVQVTKNNTIVKIRFDRYPGSLCLYESCFSLICKNPEDFEQEIPLDYVYCRTKSGRYEMRFYVGYDRHSFNLDANEPFVLELYFGRLPSKCRVFDLVTLENIFYPLNWYWLNVELK